MQVNEEKLCCEELLEDLEKRIDCNVEENLERKWQGFLDGEFVGDIFSPTRSRVNPAQCQWPQIMVNDTLDNEDYMLAQQLCSCSWGLSNWSGPLAVRCNYGVVILPSLFGVELFLMERGQNCLPNCRHLQGGVDTICKVIEKGIPDLEGGLGGKVLSMGHKFKEAFAPYPNISKYVHVYHPDLQGPMDVCELLWGSEIFVELYDEPEAVNELLDLVTRTYVAFMRKWWEIFPPREDKNVHLGLWHKGNILLRDDSAMNLSAAMYEEFILPYNQRLLNELGGGALHACGRVDHWLPVATSMDGLYAFNMSQPEYNDMEKVYQHTVDKGIPLIGFNREAAELAVEQGRDLKGLVHV